MRYFLKRLFRSEDTRDLHERLEKLEIAMRRLDEEWTDVYNKFRTLQMRVAKQVQRLDAVSSQEEPQGAGSDELNGYDPRFSDPKFSSLSPRQAKIQREILARRQRGGVSTEGGE